MSQRRLRAFPNTIPTIRSLSPAPGIYFQPFVEPRAGWRLAVGLDYASMTELAFGFSTDTSFLLDAESYRFSVGIAKDLGPMISFWLMCQSVVFLPADWMGSWIGITISSESVFRSGKET